MCELKNNGKLLVSYDYLGKTLGFHVKRAGNLTKNVEFIIRQIEEGVRDVRR